MQIIRFVDSNDKVAWGRLLGPSRAQPLRGDLFGEHEFGEQSVRVARLLPPAVPPNIFAVGRNYPEHAAEMKAEDIPAEPLVFLKATTAVIGPGEDIILPRSAPDEVDYEGELAVVIGRLAKDVAPDNALDHVFGYTCANDVTARDCQKRRDRQWTRAKSFDTFCPLGPMLVTGDELRADALRIRTLVNDREMQNASTAEMVFSVPELVSYLSHQFTLRPGTVILTGTPSGVGAARSPQVFLRPGDQVSVEINGIGQLTNRVAKA